MEHTEQEVKPNAKWTQNAVCMHNKNWYYDLLHMKVSILLFAANWNANENLTSIEVKENCYNILPSWCEALKNTSTIS